LLLYWRLKIDTDVKVGTIFHQSLHSVIGKLSCATEQHWNAAISVKLLLLLAYYIRLHSPALQQRDVT